MKSQKKSILILVILTIIKVITVCFFYQNVIDSSGPDNRLVSGYGWDQLVSSMHEGKYEMTVQNGLSDIYDYTSKSYRPPIYPAFLFFMTLVSNNSAVALILVQSIITSLVAYLGYMIVKLGTGREKASIFCLFVLFIFPMNFLKSGTIDESPLFLVFVLSSLYTLSLYIKEQKRSELLVFSGIFLGLATMTRYTALFIAILLLPFILISREVQGKRFKKILLFFLPYSLVLLPWILRNYTVYGEPTLSSGAGRILLFTQSNDFIERFPNESVDEIERKSLRAFHNSHQYLSNLDAFSLDKEFVRLALNKIKNFPYKFFRSLFVKLKVFFPSRYYPNQDSKIKDIIFISMYYLILFFFLLSFFQLKHISIENKVTLIALIGIIASGVVYFMLSRHFYGPIVLMILFSCLTSSYRIEELLNRGVINRFNTSHELRGQTLI